MQKQLRAVKWHILKTSKDEEARKLHSYRLDLDQKGHIGRGRDSSPCLDLENLERARALDALSVGAQFDRKGLGFKRDLPRKPNHRAELICQLKKEAEAKRLVILHQYEMQASWLSWGLDRMMTKDLSWETIRDQYSQRLLKFVLNSQQNTLPTPDNLRRWNLNKDAICGLCGERAATLSHVLAGCYWVRTVENKLPREDRYTWRHNNILLLLAKAISEQLVIFNASRPGESKSQAALIQFVRPGQKPRANRQKKRSSLLDGACDWKGNFDLPEFQRGSAYVFPHDVCLTPLRIDGYILSRTAKICIGIELTFAANLNGWKFHAIIVEVGARGWIPPSVPNALRKLGIPSYRVSSLLKNLTLLALKSSYVIWLNRFNKDFQPWRLPAASS